MASKMGRPKVEIDPEQFEKLCNLHCTQTDIAGWFKCSPDTIERFVKSHYGKEFTFAEIYKRHAAVGNVSLRRKQREVAMGGNVPMLIFLGKVQLGQREITENIQRHELGANSPQLSVDEVANLIRKARTEKGQSA